MKKHNFRINTFKGKGEDHIVIWMDSNALFPFGVYGNEMFLELKRQTTNFRPLRLVICYFDSKMIRRDIFNQIIRK